MPGLWRYRYEAAAVELAVFLPEVESELAITSPEKSVVQEAVEHELKTWPDYFRYLVDGTKTFEYRRNDRGFKVGDVLYLREWEPTFERYTGREMRRTVTYVLPVSKEFVVMALAPLPDQQSSSQVAQEAEALLEKITPGEWRLVDRSAADDGNNEPFVKFGDGWEDSTLLSQANAEFIAAAPRLVRALLEALTAKDERIERLVQSNRIIAEQVRSDAEAKAEAAEQERDTLRAQLTAKDEELRSLREKADWFEAQSERTDELERAEKAEAELRSLREASAGAQWQPIPAKLHEAIKCVIRETRGFKERKQESWCRVCRYKDPLGTRLHDPDCSIYLLHGAWEEAIALPSPPGAPAATSPSEEEEKKSV